MKNNILPHCTKCIHYFITWDPTFPHGCRVFRLKSKRYPCLDILKVSGERCQLYEEKTGLVKGVFPRLVQ